MFREITEFIMTGFSVLTLYVVYFFISFLSTILLGIPIGFGVYYVHKFVTYFFNGV